MTATTNRGASAPHSYKELILIACSKSKQPLTAFGQDLYTGQLFTASRAYAESVGSPFLILSAKHHVVTPDQLVIPYDETLKGKADRLGWSKKTARALHVDFLSRYGFPEKITFLAGKLYVEFLIPELRKLCGKKVAEYSTPLAGAGIGQQKAILKKMTKGAEK